MARFVFSYSHVVFCSISDQNWPRLIIDERGSIRRTQIDDSPYVQAIRQPTDILFGGLIELAIY
jgi:hypothetical protein